MNRKLDTAIRQRPLGLAQLDRLLRDVGLCLYRSEPRIDGSYTFLGELAEELFGEPREALIGVRGLWFDRVHPEDRERIASEISAGLVTGHGAAQYRLRHADGSWRLVKASAMTETDASGQCVAVIGVMSDVTSTHGARAAVREAQSVLAALADNVHEVLWVSSPKEGRLMFLSSSFDATFGLPSSTVRENPWGLIDRVHPDDRQRMVAEINAARDGMPTVSEFRVVDDSGATRWIRSRMTPVTSSDGTVRLAGVSEDITADRLASERAHAHQAEIESSLAAQAERIVLLERQRLEAEKLAAGGRMSARIAHEINNPLAGIRNAFLLVKSAIPPEHPHNEFVPLIEREIGRLTAIVRQMYELHRPSPPSARTRNAREVLRDVAALARAASERGAVQLDLGDLVALPELAIAEHQLRQVLFNLVQNAIEAAPRGSTVRVSAALAGTGCSFFVEDTGPGIPEEAQALICEPFYTTKTEMGSGGLGLGLSITKSILEAAGGAISFVTRAGQGTVFRIDIPGVREDRTAGEDSP